MTLYWRRHSTDSHHHRK